MNINTDLDWKSLRIYVQFDVDRIICSNQLTKIHNVAMYCVAVFQCIRVHSDDYTDAE